MSPERKPRGGPLLPREWWVVIGERAHRKDSFFVEWFRTEAKARETYDLLRSWNRAYRSVKLVRMFCAEEEVVESWQREN